MKLYLPLFDVCVDKGTFPSAMKHTNITPACKKGKGYKEKYRLVSILPVISKIFEKLICNNQITPFIDQFLSKYQCGFRKRFNAQHWLLAILEKWKKAVETKKAFGALLTDFSKAFDCLPHGLIITKLNAYGFSLPALDLIQNYLVNRKRFMVKPHTSNIRMTYEYIRVTYEYMRVTYG